ncbi:MAG: hypothetical protein GXP37_09480 [Chloroflexi bacterium]|nr:hypothetical protein [Chloroflexota bacterium]
MVPPSARSLVFLADTAFRSQRWTQFIPYFSSRGFSCYAIDLAANTCISYDKNAVPAEPSPSPLHSPTDLLKNIAADQKVFCPQAPLVLLSAAPTAAAAIALARQQGSPIGAVAILHPPWRLCAHLWRTPLAPPVWLALAENALCARWPWPFAATLTRHPFQGMRHVDPQERGWERVAYALRRWLQDLPQPASSAASQDESTAAN